MRVLIAGCGYVGTALARGLQVGGHEVLALRRSPRPLPEGVGSVTADLGDPSSLAAIPAGVEALVYTVAPDAGDEAAYRAAYVTGLANLRAHLGRQGSLRRLLLASSTAVYAQTDEGWVDESSPTEPTHFGGRILLEAEALARSAPCVGVAVRFGGIYGPGREGLIERVREGRARFDPAVPRYTNRIHRDDCAGVLHHLLELAAPPPVVVAVDEDPAPEREVLAWLADRLGAPVPVPARPDPGRRRGRANRRCSSARLVASGYRFIHPSYRDGYGALIALREQTEAG